MSVDNIYFNLTIFQHKLTIFLSIYPGDSCSNGNASVARNSLDAIDEEMGMDTYISYKIE